MFRRFSTACVIHSAGTVIPVMVRSRCPTLVKGVDKPVETVG